MRRAVTGRTRMGRAGLALALIGLSVLVPARVGAVTAAARARPTIRLLSQPIFVAPDGAFDVSLSVANAPAGGALAVDLYDRVAKVSDLTNPVPTRDPIVTFDLVPLATQAVAQQTASFAIQLYPAGAGKPNGARVRRITQPGVYPVRVRLRDSGAADADNIASFATTLIRTPEPGQQVGRADIAVLPIVHSDPPKDPAARAGTDLVDPSLAARLPAFVRAFADHPSVPVSLAVTPDTSARLDRDVTGASVRELRVMISGTGRQLLGAPYVDVDPSQLVATGQNDELGALLDLGQSTLADHLGTPAPGTWFLRKSVDPAALPVLRNDGITRLVLPAGALSGPPSRRAVTVGGGAAQVTVLQAETGYLDALVGATDPIRAAHQLLARLTLSASEQPGSQLVLPLDPRVDPRALGVVLDALTLGAPSYRAAPLDDVFANPKPLAAGSALVTPVPSSLPGYQQVVTDVSADLSSYRSMAVASNTSTADDDRAFTRGLAFSAAVDLPLPQRIAELQAVQARARSRFAGVSIRSRDKVTLGSRRARFPLPVASTLNTPVKVIVELAANDRLDFPDDRIPVTLRGDRTIVDIPVRTRTSGDTPVLITIRSPDGRVILSEGRYTIRSTAVSGSGLILTIGAAAFLALWWGRHWVRDRRQSGPRRARARTST